MYIKQNNTQLIHKMKDELSIDTHDCLNRVQTH